MAATALATRNLLNMLCHLTFLSHVLKCHHLLHLWKEWILLTGELVTRKASKPKGSRPVCSHPLSVSRFNYQRDLDMFSNPAFLHFLHFSLSYGLSTRLHYWRDSIIGHRSAPAHSPLASEADAALDDFPIAHPLLSTGTLFSLNPLLSCNISYIL